jgi:arginine:ornithine antiporter/lysine permease
MSDVGHEFDAASQRKDANGLKLGTLVALVVGSMIGGGIFGCVALRAM